METEFTGRRIVVMGLGRFGGGIGVTRWLAEQGADVVVTDMADQADLAASLESLADLNITYHLGNHRDSDLDGCELLVVSPAVDKNRSAFFKAALDRGIPWSSEMNLFLERCPAQIVGITGTVGKSTTTAMIGQILDLAKADASWLHGEVYLGGNIGKSLLDDLSQMKGDDIAVLELSSFQLEDAAQVGRSPCISLVTNVRDNHTDRHGTIEAYAKAKGNIFKYQTRADWLVLPFEGGVEWLPDGWQGKSHLYRFGVSAGSGKVRWVYVLDDQDLPGELTVSLPVPGLHNLENAAAAIAISRILGVPDTVAIEALSHFRGLPHRLEWVRELNGVEYYNDSKATTPEAAMTSLKAFGSRGLVMLVGGSDKGSSFTALGEVLASQAKAVVCMGATQEAIQEAITAAMTAAADPYIPQPHQPEAADVPVNRSGKDNGMKKPRIEPAGSFTEALKMARHLASPGDVVCLSPGCASFDWFRNYEERGDVFKRIVMGWSE